MTPRCGDTSASTGCPGACVLSPLHAGPHMDPHGCQWGSLEDWTREESPDE